MGDDLRRHSLAAALLLASAMCGACAPIPAPMPVDDDAGDHAPESPVAGGLFDYYPEARLLRMGERVPDLQVQDRDGRALSLSAFRGDVVVLAFVGATGNDARRNNADGEDAAGNDVDGNDAEMLRRLAEFGSAVGPALAEEIRIVTLVLDTSPTPAVALAARESAAIRAGVELPWAFLGATPRNAALLAASFGVVVWQYADGRIGHNFNTVVIDPAGIFVDQFPGLEAWSPRDLVAAAGLAASR